jgi:hypothetical protein
MERAELRRAIRDANDTVESLQHDLERWKSAASAAEKGRDTATGLLETTTAELSTVRCQVAEAGGLLRSSSRPRCSISAFLSACYMSICPEAQLCGARPISARALILSDPHARLGRRRRRRQRRSATSIAAPFAMPTTPWTPCSMIWSVGGPQPLRRSEGATWPQAGPSNRCLLSPKPPIMHLSYTSHTHLITPYTPLMPPATPLTPPSVTPHPPLIHPSCIPHTPLITPNTSLILSIYTPDGI